MKLITRDTDYALKALCFIAAKKGKIVAIPDLIDELKMPRPFLRKILQVLNKKGLLKSLRGPKGGFLLGRPSKNIFLTDIMRIFQGELKLNACFLKKMACPDKKRCPLRKRITKIEEYVLGELRSINIASLAK